MSQQNSSEDVTKKTVVYTRTGMESVTVRRDEVYRRGEWGVLTMDLYYPPGREKDSRLPAVVIVAGYPGAGVEAKLGSKFKDMGWSVSWGRLLAASGLVAIAYTNRDPAADLVELLRYARRNSASLGLDEDRLGLLASSGNVPLALWVLIRRDVAPVRCAALCYGYTLDGQGSTGVLQAAAAWGFAHPGAGNSVADLPGDVPLFLARAGRDEFPLLNETLDRFVADALSLNLPLTLVNHREAPHAFDLFHDSETSREIVRRILEFLCFHLRTASGVPLREPDRAR